MTNKDKEIPINDSERALIARYLKDIQDIRNLLNIKSQALDDMLGLMIEARGLSRDTHAIDAAKMAIVEKGQKEELSGENN